MQLRHYSVQLFDTGVRQRRLITLHDTKWRKRALSAALRKSYRTARDITRFLQ